MTKRLWAKSWQGESPPRNVMLPGHLADVYHSASRVIDATGNDQLSALGLDPREHRARFRRLVLFAAAMHDLGKANDHFQEMITRQRDIRLNPQGLRHEWVTLLMMWELRNWLYPALSDDLDWTIAEWAIVGHHPGVNHASPPDRAPSGAGPEIKLFMGDPDFAESLQQLRLWFELAEAPKCETAPQTLQGNGNVFTKIKKWSMQCQRQWDRMPAVEKRLVAAVKNCLVAADVAGSALPQALSHDPHPLNWIEGAFHSRPDSGALKDVVEHRLNGHSPREFQLSVANAASRVTFVKAGCGSGKTLAAYMWAAQNHPTRRLYFCYPTTGTATEGFRDYLFDESENTPRVGAKLFHSRRDIDFEIILNTGRDSDDVESAEDTRLESLEAWWTPVVACTVDMVLGLLQNIRRGLIAWPALAQSAFVFDEIHAFDDKLFGTLLRFLRDLPGLPVLLMTASLPAPHETAIRELLEEQGQAWSPISGPHDLEERPRYHRLSPSNGPLEIIKHTFATGGKVLWVCNTVARVMAAAETVSELSPLLYHSRFKYEDRVERHQDVIHAFKEPGPAIAICSQVAEMSLDLSADLLVTDLAPVPALIQRLGRLNRRAEAGSPTKPFIVAELDEPLPYRPEDLESAREWLNRLATQGVSQRDLALAWEQTADEPPMPSSSAWLDGGSKTEVNELREPSLGITVLMQEDRERVRSASKTLSRYIIPMPAPRDSSWKSWERERGLPVAPPGSIVYDPQRGALWQK